MPELDEAARKTHGLVREAYGEVARRESSCCGPTPCGSAKKAVSEGDQGLSCGDPVAFSRIK